MQSLLWLPSPIVAVFSFTQTSYNVVEGNESAAVIVELSGCDLDFDINVTVLTIDVGPRSGNATGIVNITAKL